MSVLCVTFEVALRSLKDTGQPEAGWIPLVTACKGAGLFMAALAY